MCWFTLYMAASSQKLHLGLQRRWQNRLLFPQACWQGAGLAVKWLRGDQLSADAGIVGVGFTLYVITQAIFFQMESCKNITIIFVVASKLLLVRLFFQVSDPASFSFGQKLLAC